MRYRSFPGGDLGTRAAFSRSARGRLIWPAAIALGAALLLASPAAAATVRKVGRLPLIAAAGGQVEMRLQVRGPATVGLVLSRSARSAKHGIKLGGAGVRVRGRGTRRVRIRASIPVSIAEGKQMTLFACVNAASGVRTGQGCRALGKVPTSGPTLRQRLDAAVAAHRLTSIKAMIYGLYALNANPRLPLELRAKSAGQGGIEGLLRVAAESADSLPRSVRRELVWYFVPPPGLGSAWRGVGRGGARVRPARAQANCIGFNALADSPYTGQWRAPWVGVPTSDGKAVVWYVQGENDAQATARLYARILPGIWAKLTSQFQEPKSDAREECFHGPDGRFDVYVNKATTLLASQFRTDVVAVTNPYPAARGRWCTGRPSWMSINPGQPRWTLAHELMHAIQFSYTYASCQGVSWWDEGSATWAGDFVYPRDDLEKRFSGWLEQPLAKGSISDADYDAFPFWMMLQRTQGTGVLRQIFAKLASARSVPAVDAAIPGGLARQWPRFGAYLLNQDPIGRPGFDLKKSFAQWDSWPLTPQLRPAQGLALGGASERTIVLPSQNRNLGPLTIDAYHRVSVSDPLVREIRFKNGAGDAGVLAELQLANGSWRLEDWSGKSKVTLCRDKAGQDVHQLVIITANPGRSALRAFKHELRGRDSCAPPPPAYKANVSGTAVYDSNELGAGNSLSANWSGNVVARKSSAGGGYPGSPTTYTLRSGAITYSYTGHAGGCDVAGSGPIDLGAQQDLNGNTVLEVYDATPRAYALNIPMTVFATVHGTKSNCDNASDNGGDFAWNPGTGVPWMAYAPYPGGPVGNDWSISGSGSGNNGSGTPDQTWHWSLTPTS